MLEWLAAHETLLWWLGAGSLVMFAGTLAVVPVLVARIPADYFAADQRPRGHDIARHPALRALLIVLKNLLGLILLPMGIAMLVLPGQGLLTILVALLLLDFPGKYRAERWLVGQPAVFRAINWLRRRRGCAPLRAPA